MSKLDVVFAELNAEKGNHNLVSLVDLRREMGMDRASLDAIIQNERRAYRYSLVGAEGRHGISPAEREAAIRDHGELLLFISRRVAC